MYTALLRGHCCNWMSDYCQIACVHVCVCLSVCVGVGAHFYVKERAVATVELKQERSTLRSHTESIRQRSGHVLSLWFLSLTLTLWFLSVVWHPIIPCLSPSPLLYMLHRFIFPSFSISSFPSSRILLFYLSSHFSTRPAYHPAIPYPVSSFEVFAIYPLFSGPLPILSSHHPAEAIGISLID